MSLNWLDLLSQRFQAGVVIFGKHQWLRHGEVFSVVFGFISRFSVTEIRVAEPMVCRDCYSGKCLQDGSFVACYECPA